jgi:hypothetical protein
VSEQLHLAVALDGYGWHPEAWRHTPELEPVTSGRYWSGWPPPPNADCSTSSPSTTRSRRSGAVAPKSSPVGSRADPTL